MRELWGRREDQIALSLLDVLVPAGKRLQRPGPQSLRELKRVLGHLGEPTRRAYPGLMRALDAVVRARYGHDLTQLSDAERASFVELLGSHAVLSLGLQALLTPLKIARARELFDEHEGRRPSLPQHSEHARWQERVVDASAAQGATHLDADVVVVGTGAGGAAVAKALATRGHAVVMLEEGAHHTRHDFARDVLERQEALYRPMTFALGNALIPVPTGIGVGGTTTINSGTCFRPPEALLRRLRFEHGLTELTPTELEPYFARAEAMLEVAPTAPHLLSASERMIARGAEALGLSHGPLLRNAPGCDGQSECCFGCPTDAKRSTNVSYVPAALKAGAMLYTHVRVERIMIEGGAAVGVVGRARRSAGPEPFVVVRARAVVLACGTFGTPLLLMKNGLGASSGQLGKNLTLHPASHAWALFDRPLEGGAGVPQGYCVDALAEAGIRIEGGLPPPQLAAMTLMASGSALTRLLERYDRLAFSGFMIRDDHSRGQVSLDGQGKLRVRYHLDPRDVSKLVEGHTLLARLFFAAGAERVMPGILRGKHSELSGPECVELLERDGRTLRARDFALTAFHPLGTCRMGRDPKRSVVSQSHELHDIARLYVCDGSAVPGPLGVNPQITIMALSERAAERIEARLHEGGRVTYVADTAALRPPSTCTPQPCARAETRREGRGSNLRFEETMSGVCHALTRDRSARRVVLRVRAETCLETLLSDLRAEGGVFRLEGSLDVEGLTRASTCRGTLTLSPRTRERALVYALQFETEQGEPYTLYGEKRLDRGNLLAAMTTLYTEICRGEPGAPVMRGILRFPLRELGPWLRSFRRESA